MFLSQLALMQEVVEPPNPLGLIIFLVILLVLTAIPLAVIGFVLVIVVRMLLLQRAPKKTLTDTEIEARLVQIRQLAREQKFRDGTLLMWETFSIAAQTFLGVFRAHNQSARQFGIMLMNRGDIDPSAIEAIISLFEKARYGKSDITITEFNDGLGGLHRFLQVATAHAPPEPGAPEGAEPAYSAAGPG